MAGVARASRVGLRRARTFPGIAAACSGLRTRRRTDLVLGLAFRPDGRALAGAKGKTLTLWEVPPTPTRPK
jgi:hypothetical protein